MNKKIIAVAILGVFLFSGVASAQTDDALPSAGLTPESNFYFLDKLGEALREFFTFNPEAKARLNVAFAAERVAEIKVILETKGVEAKGLSVAQARLEANAAKAADLVEKEKARGKDVSKLAGEIVDNFHIQRKAAKQVFDDAKQEFFTKKRELHNQLLAAIEAGDTAAQERIRAELAVIEAAKDEAETKKDAAIAALESEKDRLQDELEEKKREEDQARDEAERADEERKRAEERQQELEEKIREEEAKRQEKLKEAQERQDESSKREAEKEAERLEKSREQLEKEQEQALEARNKAEEKQREADEKAQEAAREAMEVENKEQD